ncbi:MAG: uracil-DNA glycosylase [Promethearchaeota archaeon]
MQCKWYFCCPMRRFYEQGRLDEKWVREYCWVANEECVRYQKEERGEYHEDYMLPDGSLDPGLVIN